MKTKKIVATFAIISVVLIGACKKDKNEPAQIPTSSGTTLQTIPVQSTVQPTVALAGAANFAILAGSSVTNTDATNITGDLGLSSGTSVGGFPPGILVGTQHVNDNIANQAKLDLTAAYNDAAGRTCTDIVTLSGNIGGLTLTPGLYKSTSSLAISSGDLTFDAKGNASAVFIIQIASTLTTTGVSLISLLY